MRYCVTCGNPLIWEATGFRCENGCHPWPVNNPLPPLPPDPKANRRKRFEQKNRKRRHEN